MKTKKILAVLLIITMLISALPTSVLATGNEQANVNTASISNAKITVKDNYGKAGATVNVNIVIAENPGILGLTLKLEFDESVLTLLGMQNGPASGMNFTPSKGEALKSGCELLWDAESVDMENIQDGVIATLTFQIAENAEPNDIAQIKVSCIDALDKDALPLSISTFAGQMQVLTYTPGDVNDDGEITTTDVVYLRRFIAGGYNVTINEFAGDVNNDGMYTSTDVVYIRRYIAGGYGVELKPSTPRCEHSLTATLAKEAECTVDGNIAYWYCSKCEKYFADANATTEISLADTVIEKTGHTYTDVWASDEAHHWHSSTCGHNEEIKDKSEHVFGNDNLCDICSYGKSVKLEKPIITSVKYDTVYWDPVPNANQYVVRVNDNYTCTLRGNVCLLKDLDWDGKPLSNIGKGFIKVEVMALGYGEYEDSEWSAADTSYYYVTKEDSEDVAVLQSYKIGYGYNLIEDSYLDITESSNVAVFDHNKLLALGDYSGRTPASSSAGSTYRYSSMDEFLTKTNEEYNLKLSLSMPLIGTLKSQFKAGIGTSVKNYEYVETLIYIENRVYADYKIQNITPSEYVHCLSDKFLMDLRCESPETEGFANNPEELAKYIYENYGTHAILGVTTGGAYFLEYMVATNESSVATDVRVEFEAAIKSGKALSKVLKSDFGVGIDLSESNSSTTSTTTAKFTGYSYGGNGRTPVNADDASSAIADWSSGFSEDTAVSIAFTKDGAIDLVSLIGVVRPDFVDVFETYINNRADDTYIELNNEFSTELANTFIDVVEENGENVLKIDLSAYQLSGSLENANSSYLINDILTIHPIMRGKNIDKIHVIGGLDTVYKRNLIDSLTLQLSSEWSRDVKVVIEDLGAICGNSQGIVDTSLVTRNIDVSVEYKGINIIQSQDGIYHLKSDFGYGVYNIDFELGENDVLDLTTLYEDGDVMVLPVALNKNYHFIYWCDSEGNPYTDSIGNLLIDCADSAEVIKLYGKWTPKVYEITLDNQEAESAGTTRFFEKYNTGTYSEFEAVNTLNSIQIPVRKGYVFNGYFRTVENNGLAEGFGTDQIISSDGTIIAPNTAFEGNETLYALWIPQVFEITLDSGNAQNPGTESYYQQYLTGIYSDDKCSISVDKITVPSRPGYVFGGYYESVNNNYSENAVGTNRIVDTEGKILVGDNRYLENTTLIALWTINKYEITYHTFTQSTETYVMPCDSIENDNPIIINYEHNLIFNDPVRTKYDKFIGWYADAEFTIPINEKWIENWYENPTNISLYAKWDLAVYYNTLEGTPQLRAIGDRTRIVVDWSAYANGTYSYTDAIDPDGNGYRADGVYNTNLDVYPSVTEIYLIGDSASKYTGVNIIPGGFAQGQELIIHLENFHFEGYISPYADNGMYLTIDCTSSNYIGGRISGFVKATIAGNGYLTVLTPARTSSSDGRAAIDVDELIVSFTGFLWLYGGDGGNGTAGTSYSRSSNSSGSGRDGGNGGNAGDGGAAIKANKIHFVNPDNLYLTLESGDGGTGGNGGNGEFAPHENKISGHNYAGDGGNGGTGGNGGAVIIADTIITDGVFKRLIINIGDGGNGGRGGHGGHADKAYVFGVVTSYSHPGDGGTGGTAGTAGTVGAYTDALMPAEDVQISEGTSGTDGTKGSKGEADLL